jgi:hypothetical protein
MNSKYFIYDGEGRTECESYANKDGCICVESIFGKEGLINCTVRYKYKDTSDNKWTLKGSSFKDHYIFKDTNMEDFYTVCTDICVYLAIIEFTIDKRIFPIEINSPYNTDNHIDMISKKAFSYYESIYTVINSMNYSYSSTLLSLTMLEIISQTSGVLKDGSPIDNKNYIIDMMQDILQYIGDKAFRGEYLESKYSQIAKVVNEHQKALNRISKEIEDINKKMEEIYDIIK